MNSISLTRIVGHLMADGYISKRYLRYNNQNLYLIENFKKHFKICFPKTHFIQGKNNSETFFVQVQNKEVINFLFTLCKDFRSSSPTLPKFINNLDMKKEFIGTIFDDEGCVAMRIYKKTNEIKRNLDIASKSKKFLEDIKRILEDDFNIKCNNIIEFKRKLNNREFTTYKLSITGKENFMKFREIIPFVHSDKIRKLDLMINSYIRK